MQTKKTKRLYYIAGIVPTKEEADEAAELRITALRNAAVAERSSFLEVADEVAGKVPVGYLKMEGCKILPSKKKAEK